jgi:streptogramin lyase
MEEEVVRKQQLGFVGVALIFSILACQSGANSAPEVHPAPLTPTSLGVMTPTAVPLAPTGTADNGLNSLLPPDFLTDPNTACAVHDYIGFSCLDGTGWHIYAQEINKSYLPNAMTQCSDGRTYIAFYDKIYQVIFNKIDQAYGRSLVYLGDINTSKIYCGQENEIWTASNGIDHFDGTSWIHYSIADIFGSSVQEMYGVDNAAVAPNGNVWVINREVLATFDGSYWQIVTLPGDYYFKNELRVDLSGNVWVVPETGQLLMYDGNQWSAFPVPEYGIRSIALDNQNRIWAASEQNQVYVLEPQTQSWLLQSGSQKLGSGAAGGLGIYAMQFDNQDRLRVATDYGVNVFDGTSWYAYNYDLNANRVLEILVFGDGPALPMVERAPGSVRGKLVNSASGSSKVQLCLSPMSEVHPAYMTPIIHDPPPCTNQTYNALADVDSDGYFEFTDVPPGRYYLMYTTGYFWHNMVDIEDLLIFEIEALAFKVDPGAETQLGNIVTHIP